MTDSERAALAPLARALSAATRSIRALDAHLQHEAGAQRERDTRAEQLHREVLDTLDELPAEIDRAVAEAVRRALADRPSTAVEQARSDLAVELLRTPTGLLAWLRAAPRAAWTWIAADRARAALLLTTLGGVIFQAADGAPLLAAIGRMLLGLSGLPTVGAP